MSLKQKLLAALLLSTLLTACSLNKPGRQADLSRSESLITSSEWAVISSPYAAFRSESSIDAEVSSHGRQGDVCEIAGKKIVKSGKETVIWYKFADGWLSENDITVCTNSMQAEKLSADMLNGI